ncbi:MAG: tetratricopeptide repeat protein [Pyrinomonadaceae bacterium]
MKRCPTCQRAYTDEALKFCRHDGTALVSDSSPLSDSQETLVKLPAPDADAVRTEIFRPEAASNATSSSLTMPLSQRRRRSSKSKVIDSLAVLPFANEGGDANNEYLSEGITESIINSLSQLPRLRVVPRSTVFRYKGRGADPQEVGRELSVRAVLTGRVLQLKELLVVKTELVDVEQEAQLWGEQYRRQLTDIFDLQEDISQEISAKLRLRLSGEERKRLTRRYTENTEAYHLYLKGRYYTNRRTAEWIGKGIEHFRRAIDLDPNYALAHAGLADAYAFLSSSTGECPPREFYPKAEEAALKALEIDEGLAEAHTSLGFVRLLYDWDLAGARREFKRAIDLNPNYANAHDGYSFYLKATGRHEKAVRECREAQKLDPLSTFAGVSLGWAYYFARQYDKAVEQNRKALEMDPRFIFAYWNLGAARAQQGRTEDAVSAFAKASELSGGGLTFRAHLGYAYALAGQGAEARKIITELEESARLRYVSAYYFAIIHLGLGERGPALDWLERAAEERSGFLAFVKVEPMLDGLRGEARFVELSRLVGVAPRE